MSENRIPRNPFPGLRPFEEGECQLFFGREGQSKEIMNRLERHRFLAVVGTSGSGKSSLIRAGLFPMLRKGFKTRFGSAWRVALFRPGDNPTGNMAIALSDDRVLGSSDVDDSLEAMLFEATLRRSTLGLVETVRQARRPPDENLLIVVDQFEEIFRLKQNETGPNTGNESAAFIKLLLEATRQHRVPIYVVITMRSDFLGDCSQFRDLPETLNDGQYLVPRMTREQRREAITGPITLCGGQIANRLLNRLLNDVGDNPDQLPVLQHALMRTWDHWKLNGTNGEPIDLRDYEGIGGMDEALSRHADKAYNELKDERSRRIAEILFKALTEKGSDNREIRRPMQLSEICDVVGGSDSEISNAATEAEVIGVIEKFRKPGRSFLMPPSEVKLKSESRIDISHESLIRGWKRLRDWVDEEANSAEIYRRLAEASARHKRGEAALWIDPDLMLAQQWRDENHPNRFWAERYAPNFNDSMSFIDQSQAEKKARLRRERRRTRVFILVMAIALVVSSGLAVYARLKKVEAEESTRKAEKLSKKFAEEYTRARKQSSQLLSMISTQVDDLIKVSSPKVATKYHLQKADALSLMGEYKGALAELDKALEILPNNAQLLLARGTISASFAQMANRTVADLEFASKDIRYYNLYANMAFGYAQLGNYKKAEEDIHLAINAFRFDGIYFFEGQVWPDITGVTGMSLVFTEEDEAEIALLYEIANIRAAAGDKGFPIALQEANQAADKKAINNQDLADGAYLTALNWSWLQRRTEDYGGFVSEGALWERLKRPDLAQCSYHDFSSRYEKEASPRYAQLATWVERRTAELGPSDPSDCSRRRRGEEVISSTDTLAVDADVARAMRNWEDADKSLTMALEREPKNISLLIQRARIRFEAGYSHDARWYAKSLEDCETILALSPHTPVAYILRARNKYELLPEDKHVAASVLKLAASDLEEALKDDPSNIEALMWLGQVLSKSGKSKEALSYYNRALELSPDMVELDPIIARLKKSADAGKQAHKSSLK